MVQSSRTRQLKYGLIISSVAALLSIGAVELTLHLLTEPSEGSSGTLFGHELPPLRVIPSSPPAAVDRSDPYEELVMDGARITIGDLNGAYREDSLTGHVPLENWSSANGWWANDAFGARLAREATAEPSTPESRVLIFGDSFAVGLGLRQGEVWSSVLQAERPDAEFLNFGVPGYGMGQSVLRYEQVRDALPHDAAILVFVPGADLWRDINVVRNVGEEGWISYNVLPRFVQEDDRLRLIASPYENSAELYADNSHELSEKLRQHLVSYDRFYFPAKYERAGVWSESVVLKMLLKVRFDRKRAQIRNSLPSPGSEATRLSRALFDRMDEQVQEAPNSSVRVDSPASTSLPTSWRHLRTRSIAPMMVRISGRWRIFESLSRCAGNWKIWDSPQRKTDSAAGAGGPPPHLDPESLMIL
jgi:hypothetical protein